MRGLQRWREPAVSGSEHRLAEVVREEGMCCKAIDGVETCFVATAFFGWAPVLPQVCNKPDGLLVHCWHSRAAPRSARSSRRTR